MIRPGGKRYPRAPVAIDSDFVKGEKTMSDGMNLVIVQVNSKLAHEWGWLLAFGIVLAALGVVAVIRSFAATVASMIFFGWLLLFAGIVEFTGAFMVGHRTGFFLHLLAAILLTVTGLVVLVRPVISAEVATLVMSMLFLIGGLYQVVASVAVQLPGSGWEILNGVIALIMGVVLLIQWPISGLWAIGLFVGIDLIFNGCAWAALAFNLHKM
jgi:uncharacterized membrane protein HdeD (DUF308 family)